MSGERAHRWWNKEGGFVGAKPRGQQKPWCPPLPLYWLARGCWERAVCMAIRPGSSGCRERDLERPDRAFGEG